MNNINITLEEYYEALAALKKNYRESIDIIELLENVDIIPNDSEYFREMVIGHDRPIKWEFKNLKIHITEKVSVVDRNTGVKYYIVQNSDISSIYIFAGKGCKKVLRVAKYLVKSYGGNQEDWFHARGKCSILSEDEHLKVDLHWYENSDIGAVSREIKEWYDMNEKDKTSKLINNPNGILTTAGILLESGEIIKDAKVINIARRGEELLRDKKYEEFEDLMYGKDAMNLSGDQIRLLSGTVLSGQNMNILEMLCHLEVMNSPDIPEE